VAGSMEAANPWQGPRAAGGREGRRQRALPDEMTVPS